MLTILTRFAFVVPIALWIMSAWQLQYAGIHMDTARDWAQALAIANGDAWPRVGPNIGRAFDLGPIWYYVLALPFALGASVSGVALWVGALFGSQYWFAYRLGCRFIGLPLGGALAAVALTLPNWQAVHMAGTTHTVLAVALTLAALCACIAWHDQPRAWRAALAGLVCAAAIHAHPTTGLVTVIWCAMLVRKAIPAAQKWQYFALFLLSFMLLFAPLIGANSPLLAPSNPISLPHFFANVQTIPSVFWHAIADAAPVQLALTADGEVNAGLRVTIWLTCLFLAFGGGLRTLRRKRASHHFPKNIAAAIGIAVALIIFSVLGALGVRGFVTFYMLAPLSALAPLLLALGWGQWRSTSIHSALIASLFGLHLINANALISAVRGDGLHMNIASVVYVGKPNALSPWPIKPMWPQVDLPVLGRFLCAHPNAALHGPAAVGIDLVSDVLTRAQCPPGKRATLGGANPSRTHWTGLPCKVLPSLDRTGSVCWHRVLRVARSNEMPAADSGVHPPRFHAQNAITKFDLSVPIAADEMLIVTHHLMEWSRVLNWRFSPNATLIDATPWYRILTCVSCGFDTPLEVRVDTDAPEGIDAVVVVVPKGVR